MHTQLNDNVQYIASYKIKINNYGFSIRQTVVINRWIAYLEFEY